MEMKSMLGAIVCVILVMAVVVPIVSSVGTVTGDFENDTDYYYVKAPLANTPDFTITYNSSTNGATYTSGTDTVNIARVVGLPLFWSESDEKGFRFSTSGSINLTTPTGNITNVTQITVSNGAASYLRSGSDEPTSLTIEGDLWHIAKTGDFGAYKSFKANANAQLYSYNTVGMDLSGSNHFVRVYTHGTVESPIVGYAYDFTGSADKTSTTALTMVYTTGNDGLLNVSGAKLTVDSTTNSSPDMWFIAPVGYTIDGGSTGGIINTLVGIIPVLLVVGIVIGIAAAIMWRRS